MLISCLSFQILRCTIHAYMNIMYIGPTVWINTLYLLNTSNSDDITVLYQPAVQFPTWQ